MRIARETIDKQRDADQVRKRRGGGSGVYVDLGKRQWAVTIYVKLVTVTIFAPMAKLDAEPNQGG